LNLKNTRKMSVSIQRSVVEQFSFNDDRKAGVQAIQRLVPEKYKMRLGDALDELEGVLRFKYPHPDTVLLKEPGLYCFLLRCGKAEAETFMEWVCEEVLPREMRRLAGELEEKDTQLALLNDDLTEAQEHTRQLEYINTGLQGEIRAQDQEIARRQEEVQDLIANRHVPRRRGIDNVLCFVDKNSDEEHQFYAIRCQRKALGNHKRYLRKRYPEMEVLGKCEDANAIHRWCRWKKWSRIFTETILT